MRSLRLGLAFIAVAVVGLILVADEKPKGWSLLPVPGAWEDVSDGKLADQDGFAWYRTFVIVPEKWAGKDLELILREIDDADETYFNGEKVGGKGSFPPRFQPAPPTSRERRYPVSGRLVKPGKANVIAVRVYDGGEKGGIVRGSPMLRAGEEAIRLDGAWQFRTGDDVQWAKMPADDVLRQEADAYLKSADPAPGRRGIEEYFPLARQEDRLTDAVEGTKGLDDVLRVKIAKMAGGKPLPPKEALACLQTPDDLTVDLIASEPDVRQPLNLTFDERGRMWLVQYLQYPFPAGLKIVSYDRYIRAKFDKVPPPPPNHFRGADKITILEDTDGDGKYDKISDFLEGLSIATSVLPGRGGVWVLNPPYLLFYPDRNRDDVPDGDPEVHLSGFGLEDTHAVANSLRWGPDGWIYGAHGSTCTAKVKVEIRNDPKTTDFLGQAIWRYHPEKHIFELYGEGGGNTFGVEIDDEGRVFSGTNWGNHRGLHYAQGGYYVKGWGKHGPLTNPHAFGFFPHMTHTGNGERLTHTYLIYGGHTLPERYHGRIIGPSALQRRIHVTRLEETESTYRTVEEPFLLTSTDGWFRPVDLKEGPDGALYIADFYENRIDHVDPRDTWDRKNGRIYRVRPKDAKPLAPFDLGKKTSAELVQLLTHPDRWYRHTALRLLGDRKDRSVAPQLRKLLRSEEGQPALEAFWALHLVTALSEEDTLLALGHDNPNLRRWGVRIIGDDRTATEKQAGRLLALASTEKDLQVRSQLASSAKRLPASVALPVLRAMFQHDEDRDDPHIPMLLWWALEAHAGTARPDVLRLFEAADLWRRPIVDTVILERLMQRYAVGGAKDDLKACARLLQLSPESRMTERLLTGIEAALSGGPAEQLPAELKSAIANNWQGGAGGARLALGVRAGIDEAVRQALGIVRDENADAKNRLEYARLFGEVEERRSVPVLLDIAGTSKSLELRQAALASLRRYDDKAIAERAIEWAGDGSTGPELQASLYSLLGSRPAWTLALLKSVDAGNVNPRSVPLDAVRTMKLHKGKDVTDLIGKHWGKVRETTPAEKAQEIDRVAALLKGGAGEASAGRGVFANTCGKCHKLFKEGGEVGPDLTGYERDNLGFWLENIVDPSAAVRDEFTNFLVATTDGRSLTGIIVEQNKQSIALRGPDGQTVRLARDRIEDLNASAVSLMPDDQLRALSDTQIRDLFAYLRAKVPAK